MVQKVAIVATVRNAQSFLKFWVDYHIAKGFYKLIIFLDDPSEEYDQSINTSEYVIIIKSGDELLKQWRTTKLFNFHKEFIETHVMSRQLLNAEIAIGICRDLKVDWLLHIDSDELFYCPNQSLASHIAILRDCGLRTFAYLNMEAVVTKVHMNNFFQEVNIFKRNKQHLSAQQLDTWDEVIKANPGKPFGFIAYSNGKSIGRVSESLLPFGVHNFAQVIDGKKRPERTEAIEGHHAEDLPVILHYPMCGFENFWNKYKSRGNFPDLWFNQYQIKDHVPLQLESRDVVLKNDQTIALDFYKGRIFNGDTKRIDYLIEKGIYVRIETPAQ